MASPQSAERAGRDESVFRNANERIEQRLDELSLRDGRSPFLCECAATPHASSSSRGT